MTEKEKFLKKLEEKRKAGLEDIKFFWNPDIDPSVTEEEIYAELNAMEDAETVEDPNFF